MRLFAVFILNLSFTLFAVGQDVKKIPEGTWVSVQDEKWTVKIEQNTMFDYYDGKPTDTLKYSISTTPCDTAYYSGKDTLHYLKKYDDKDSYCYELMSLEQDHFSLMWTTNGKVSSFQRLPNVQLASDTISHWTVRLHDKAILSGNMHKLDTITLTKGKINTSAIFEVQYFDDIPCSGCSSVITVLDTKGNLLKEIPVIDANSAEIKTTELQVLCAKAKSNYLLINFREAEKSETIPLFVFRLR